MFSAKYHRLLSILSGKSRLKKLPRHPGFISGSLMQVDTGQVCNRQVADLVGVNILWDAEINPA